MSRMGRALIGGGFALALCGCSASVPPCNAMIWMFGSADFTFDCPAVKAIPLLERQPQKGSKP